MSKKKPKRYEAADFGLITIPDVVARTPAYIDRVLPGSLAEIAGLQPNDLILFVGNDLVQSCQMLREELGRLQSGDPNGQGDPTAARLRGWRAAASARDFCAGVPAAGRTA